MFMQLRSGFLVLCCAFLLSGCFQQQQTITVHEDGRAEITMLVTFPGEMQEIASAVRARAALDPRLGAFNLENGVCEALNTLPVPDENIRMQAREIVSSESFTCRVDIAINDFPAAIKENGPIALIAGLTSSGERTYRYEMQTMPMALGELAWRGIVQQGFKEQGIEVTPDQLNAIVESDKAALKAAAVMTFRGASSTFTIRAPEILETNGKVSDDRTSVSFRTGIADAISLVLEPDKTEAPFIVFRY